MDGIVDIKECAAAPLGVDKAVPFQAGDGSTNRLPTDIELATEEVLGRHFVGVGEFMLIDEGAEIGGYKLVFFFSLCHTPPYNQGGEPCPKCGLTTLQTRPSPEYQSVMVALMPSAS